MGGPKMASKTVLSSQPADCAFGQLKAGDGRYYIEWRKLGFGFCG
jgi:hypothetical protein